MQYPMDNPVSFLANENFPRKSIIILRQAGYQMVSVSEKMPGAKDESVLRLASDNKILNNKSIQITGKFTIIERERLRQRNL